MLSVGSGGSGPDTLALLWHFLTKDFQERETCGLPYPRVWFSGLGQGCRTPLPSTHLGPEMSQRAAFPTCRGGADREGAEGQTAGLPGVGRSAVSGAALGALSCLSLAAKAQESAALSTFSLQLQALPQRQPDPGSLQPSGETLRKPLCLHTDRNMHTNTHALPPMGTQVAGPQPWRTSHKTLGPCSHQEGPEVTGDGGGRGPEHRAEETGWKGVPQGGAPHSHGGLHGRPAEAGSCFSPVLGGGCMAYHRGAAVRGSQANPTEEAELLRKSVGEFLAHQAHA